MQRILWSVSLKKAPALQRQCPKCGGGAYENSGRFRVNANGRKLDVFLIYRCVCCKATWNLTVLARVAPESVPPALYRAFLANDAELALRFGCDAAFLKRNGARFTIEATDVSVEGAQPRADGAEIALTPETPLDFPAYKAAAIGLGLSNARIRRLIETGALTAARDLLKTKLTAPVTFALRPSWDGAANGGYANSAEGPVLGAGAAGIYNS